jgi:hypothetical protein
MSMERANMGTYTGGHRRRAPERSQEDYAMSGLFFLIAFFVVLAVAGALGWTADSREGGDWSPSDDGQRCANA